MKTDRRKAAGRFDHGLDEIFGLEPRTDMICTAWCAGSWPSARPVRTRRRAVRRFPARCQVRPPEGHGRRACTATRFQALRSSAAAARPTVRSFAATPTICPRRSARSACGTRCRPRLKANGIIIVDERRGRSQDQGRWPRVVREARSQQCADHRRQRGERELPSHPGTFRRSMCCRCRVSTSTTSCGAKSWC
jgi:hypothetical protein